MYAVVFGSACTLDVASFVVLAVEPGVGVECIGHAASSRTRQMQAVLWLAGSATHRQAPKVASTVPRVVTLGSGVSVSILASSFAL